MTKLNDLSNFVADFHGVHREPSEEYNRLVAWCVSDGVTHDAPAFDGDTRYAGIPEAAAQFVPHSDADRERFDAMVDDYADWIIGTLYRPPGWSPRSSPDVWAALSHPVGLPVDAHSDELRDWARAWTAANPSGG